MMCGFVSRCEIYLLMKKLNEIPDKNPFKVPENYFEEVNRKIISDTSGYNQEVKKAGLYNRFRPILSDSSFCCRYLFFLVMLLLKLLTPERKNSQVSEVNI